MPPPHATDGTEATKSLGVRLVGDGGELLWVRAYKTSSGWRVEAIHRVGKGKSSRGATSEHESLEAARAAVD